MTGTSTLARLKRAAIPGIVLTLFAIYYLYGPRTFSSPIRSSEASFHLIIPATSSNADLCRLLLSATVLNYPVPVLIYWGAPGHQDAGAVPHTVKISAILQYLDKLLQQGKKDDLIMMVDGYDVHFQLPPEVMLQRYFALNAAADQRAAARVGARNMKTHGLKQTVVFGHDKLCWPMEYNRPACWAVPPASDPRYAFGPSTDNDPQRARARWLNSGTIMGTASEVRDVFHATLELVTQNHVTDSDQFYFSNLYGVQEYERRKLEPEPFKDVEGGNVDAPVVKEGSRNEYFIGIDYEGLMFQTMAFFRPYIEWMTFDGMPKASARKSLVTPENVLMQDVYYDKVLPADIANARPPFPPKGAEHATTALPNFGWHDLRLGINVISNNIFPLLHFTGPKEFRELWWRRMWYVPYAEELLKASVKTWRMKREPISTKMIGGKIWWKAEQTAWETGVDFGEKGGAWADSGTFLGWDLLCRADEGAVFVKGEWQE